MNKRVYIFIFLFLIVSCADEEIINNPTFTNVYDGYSQIKNEEQGMMSFYGINIDDEIVDTFTATSIDGTFTLKGDIFNLIVTDTSGETVLSGTTTSKDFSVNSTATSINDSEVSATYTGGGSFSDNSFHGTIMVTIAGGDWDGNIIEIYISGDLQEE